MLLLRLLEVAIVLGSFGLIFWKVVLPLARHFRAIRRPTVDELREEVEAQRLRDELERQELRRAAELRERMDDIFTEARKHGPNRKGELN